MSLTYYPLDQETFDTEILPLILKHQKKCGKPTQISHYTFFCAILYILKTGVAWRLMPTCYGNWHTIYTRFKRWSERKLLQKILDSLQQQKKRTSDFAWVDSTTVILHRHGSGALKKKANSR